MIRDIFIIDKNKQECQYHQSYSRTPINESLVLGFVGGMAGLIITMPEKASKSVPAGNHKFTYSHSSGFIYVIVSDVDDEDVKLQERLVDTIEKVEAQFLSLITKGTPSKDEKKQMDDVMEKILLSEIKVALVGFGGVGKTTLYQLVQGYDIPLDYLPTMFVSYKRLDGQIAETDVLLWDFAGQERFTPLWPMLLRGTNVILLVVDSSVENCLQTKRVFMKMIKNNRANAVTIGLANKQDLPKAMSAKLVKKVLGIDQVHPICAIDPSERRKIQNIIAGGIETYLKRENDNKDSLV